MLFQIGLLYNPTEAFYVDIKAIISLLFTFYNQKQQFIDINMFIYLQTYTLRI